MHTSKGQTSVAFSGAQIWNNLPAHLERARRQLNHFNKE